MSWLRVFWKECIVDILCVERMIVSFVLELGEE